MDTRAANIDVSAKIEEIKRFMPETYAVIQEKAKAFGNDVFVWVRRGLRGEPNFFHAIEGDRVVGAPFNRGNIMAELRRWQYEHGPFNIVFFADEGVF